VGLRGYEIDARPAGFGHGVTHSAGGRRRFHTDHGIRLGRLPSSSCFRLASTCDWLFFRPCGANVFSKKPFAPHAPIHVVLTVALDPGPAGATVQLVTMVELASFSDDGVAGDVDAGLHIANPGLGGLQRPLGDRAVTLAALQHLAVAVVPGTGFSAEHAGSRRRHPARPQARRRSRCCWLR